MKVDLVSIVYYLDKFLLAYKGWLYVYTVLQAERPYFMAFCHLISILLIYSQYQQTSVSNRRGFMSSQVFTIYFGRSSNPALFKESEELNLGTVHYIATLPFLLWANGHSSDGFIFGMVPLISFLTFSLSINFITRPFLLLCSFVYVILVCVGFGQVYHSFNFVNLWHLSLSSSLFILCCATMTEQNYQLRKLYEGQGLFMSSIYHEIRTPMNGVMCATEVMRMEMEKNESNKSLQEWLDVIRLSSSSLSETIDHMICFSQSMNEIPDLKYVNLNLKNFLKSLQASVGVYPRGENVSIEFENAPPLAFCDHSGVSHHPPKIFADRVLLFQILMNILANSLKFTKYGSVKLNVYKEYNYSVFRLEDTGVGMSEDFIKDSMFRPFAQELSTLYSKNRGVGLGLALTKFFVNQLNGEISIKSRKDSGTIVTIKFPFLETEDDEEIISEPTPVSPISISDIPVKSPASELSALIVDDNPLNKKVMQALLNRVGFSCWTVNSGEEAIEFFEKVTGKPDVVLMDVFMPGCGGIEAAKMILQMTRAWKEKPLIIGCSADTTETTQKQCLAVGMNSFIHKPLSREIILKLRTKVLNLKTRE